MCLRIADLADGHHPPVGTCLLGPRASTHWPLKQQGILVASLWWLSMWVPFFITLWTLVALSSFRGKLTMSV